MVGINNIQTAVQLGEDEEPPDFGGTQVLDLVQIALDSQETFFEKTDKSPLEHLEQDDELLRQFKFQETHYNRKDYLPESRITLNPNIKSLTPELSQKYLGD